MEVGEKEDVVSCIEMEGPQYPTVGTDQRKITRMSVMYESKRSRQHHLGHLVKSS